MYGITPGNNTKSPLAVVVDEYAGLHRLRVQARADMRLLNKKLAELEGLIVQKMRNAKIDELRIGDNLTLRPLERLCLRVSVAKKKSCEA